ncbi:MAG: acetyl-CoA hydrolase/transferase C-terminal domain-containing protein [Roseicyclus sp.]
MAPERITPNRIADILPREGRVWLGLCSGETALLREGLIGRTLPGLTFTGIVVPGLNRLDHVLATGARVTTFFMTPELAGAGAQLDFRPLPYFGIQAYLQDNPPDAAILMLSPPDADGLCSFGTVTDFIADLWPRIPTIIAHINPRMPRTSGTPGIPFERLSAVIEAPQELPEADPGLDEVSERFAAYAATLVPNGATVQAGIGRAPEAVLRGLTGKRDLAIHSGLIGDSAIDLLESGALRDVHPITAGVAIGTRRLYDAVSGAGFRFRPPSFTHDVSTHGMIERLITINSAISVDLDGQVYAEATPKGLVSGPGGASDFAAGARGAGLRIIVLPSSTAHSSRIVAPGAGDGPVSLGRFDTDLIVTEHGIADLRGKGPEARRAAMCAIAAPAYRKDLEPQIA